MFSKNQNYFFWILLESIINAILHSEGKILGIDIEDNEKFYIFKIYDDGEGILRKTGTYYPDKGTGLKLLKNIATLTKANFMIKKGPNGFGTSIEFQWDKFFISFYK
jgi:nitrate/nitrite-specific signal transduction histidine kinase